MRQICFISTLVVLTLLVGKTAYTQDFSNKGKDFYLCFPQHVQSSNLATLSIWITSDRASSGTITMANSAFNATFNIPANGIQEIQVPYAAAHISNGESTNGTTIQISKKSIRIRTDPGKPPVVAYAQQWAGARSAATLILPVSVLGKKYYSISFTQTGSNAGTALARSQFQVIAVKDNTVVTITPRKNGVVGTPFTVTLPLAGDMIQYQSGDGAAMTQDLTGTYIESIASATGGCNPIAVFSGSSNMTMGTPSCSGGSFDPLFQQCYPISSWGKNFGFVPFADYANGVPYRVLASENNTSVYFDGALVAVLNAGEIYPSTLTANPPVLLNPTNIKADKPICVAEYAQAMNCAGPGASVGDPDMVILNPVEQNISDITIFSSNLQAITKQWVNVVMKTIAIPTFTINGAVPTSNPWLPFASMPGYSYIKCLLPGIGSYRLKSDSGFNAICYGWGNVESYAYSAGTNVKDNYRVIGTATPYGGAGTPTICVNTASKFKISLPYRVDSMYWDFYGAQPNVWIKPPPPVLEDSTTTVSGQPVYWYSVGPLTFTTPGSYPVTITTYAPNTDGCGAEQDIDFEIEVIARPVADFTFSTSGCVTSPVLFTDNSNTSSRPVSSRYWNFGDLATATTNNPSHTYAVAGSYIVKYTLINDIGCISDTMPHTVVLSDPPVANFTTAAPYCAGGTIAFTDASTVTSPANPINVWAWNFGDVASGPNNTSALQNPSHVFATAGVYNVTLVVTTASGCASIITSIPVTIHANPVAGFNMPTAVCLPSGSAAFTDITTVAASESIGTWAWNFGDPPSGPNNTSGLQNPTHIFPLAQPYTINLVVTTTNGCQDTKTQILNSIYAEPQAAFTAPAEACVGSLIGFPDNSNAPGSSVTVWHWDFGDPASGPNNTSTLQNPTHIYATPGTYTVTLSVTSAAGCQSLTATHIASHNIIVKALPTAGISGSTTVCLNSTPFPTVSFMAAGGTGPYQVTYKINSGGPVTVPTDASGFASIQIPTNVVGAFHVELVSVVEGGPANCSQNQTGFVDIVVKDLPTATISGATTVCLNATATNITFTGTGGTAPYQFTYTINSGSPVTIPSNAAGIATVPIVTTTAGVFHYALTKVQEGSANTCARDLTNVTVDVEVKPLPTATVAKDITEVCLNAPAGPKITFTGANGSPNYLFTYNIDNGTGPGPNQTILSDATGTAVINVPTGVAGTFKYTLVSVQEGSGNTCAQNQTGFVSVTINPLPTPDFSFAAPSCETRTIAFTDISIANAGNVANWVWSFGDPTSGPNNTSTIQNPAHTFAAAGNYDVTLIVTTDKGCVSTQKLTSVAINARPKAGFIAPVACTSDIAAAFTDTSKIATPATIVAWAWNFGDPASGPNNISNLQNPTHHYTVAGNYTATLVVTSNNGCKDTITGPLFVNGSVTTANFTVQNPTALCSNNIVSLTDASTVDFGNLVRLEVYWDFLSNPGIKTVDNAPVTGTIYTHQYPEFGSPFTKTYTVRYVVYSGATCFNVLTRTITVLATPTLQFNQPPAVCSDAPSFQLTPQVTNGLPGPAGVFSGTGVSPTGLFDPTIGGGAFLIRYTFTGTNTCSNFIEQTINIYPTPGANAGPDKVVLEGGTVTLTPALNAGLPVTYLWTPPTGLSDVTSPTPSSSPSDDITYTLIVTSDKGCRDTDYVFVKVLKRPLIPNIFSPNGDRIHDVWEIPFLESYPGCSIDIYNRYGQLIYHSIGYTKPWDGKVNGKDVPIGTYYYIVDPKNGRAKMSGYVDVIR